MRIYRHSGWKKPFVMLLLLSCTLPLSAEVFTSKDGRFTIDLPSGWAQARTPVANAVLSVVKGASRIDIKPLDGCSTETCLEQKTQTDLLDVKKKKMQVVGNTYTGEEIKRVDFANGEPFFYISFFTPKNDFSSGYFLAGGNAYSILAKDLSYAQTDLIFSFISPTQTQPSDSLEMDLSSARAYDIDALPAVEEQSISLQAPSEQTPAPKSSTKTKSTPVTHLKFPRTLVTHNMPPYIKRLGHGFDLLVALLFMYALLQMGAGVVRWFIPAAKEVSEVNPNSPYPLHFERLYGTPSLIFRARDNQGNVLLSLSSRWDSLFLFGGLMLIIGAVFAVAFTGVIENTRVIHLSSFAYNTIYSAVSLIIPLGFVIFICGLLWSMLVLKQFALYDNKGQKAVYVLQRGFNLGKECYWLYFVKSKETLLLERKRFSFLRRWWLSDKERRQIASITETSPLRALLRKFTGHLWGLLRANYHIDGPMESQGQIFNTRSAFNRFITMIDKPQAVSARDLLVVSFIINIRDRDKWYPWF